MILQALYELADDEGLVQDPDFEWKPVSYIVQLDEQGKFLGFVDTHYTPPQEGKKKPKPVAKSYLVPRCGGRTIKDRAFFFYDKAEYVFGIDPDGKREADKLESRAGLFREEVRQCAEATGDPGARAILAFLEHSAGEDAAPELPGNCAGQ